MNDMKLKLGSLVLFVLQKTIEKLELLRVQLASLSILAKVHLIVRKNQSQNQYSKAEQVTESGYIGILNF